MDASKINIAFVRGDSLNEWEGKIWEHLPAPFSVHGFCSQKNLYPVHTLSYPVTRLPSSSDSFFARQYDKLVHGNFLTMSGLEEKLAHGFHIAHTAEIYYGYTSQAVAAKKRNPGLKVVTTVWDNSFGRFDYNYWPLLSAPPAAWHKKIYTHIEQNIAGVDMFLPVTEGSRDLLRFYGVPDNKIQLLTPPVIVPEETDVSAVLEQYDVKDKKIYLMVSRLVKEKGVYDVLFAWKMFMDATQDPDRVLVIISDGPERANMMRLSHDLKIASSVRFIPSLPNVTVRSLYTHAQALLLASLATTTWQEQFGYVLAEAITKDCPVIAASTGAIPEVVGDAGILCPPANPPAIARALMSLEQRGVREGIVQACQTQKEKFFLDTYIQRLSAVYRQLL